MVGSLASLTERFGEINREFNCCDTTFRVHATGIRADAAVTAARDTAESLEAQLNAFDGASAVSQLNRDGAIANEHVARIVRRGLEYDDRTAGVFDIHQGRVEQELKTFLRGDNETPPTEFDTGSVHVSGPQVSTDVELDLNGLAKGYIVDQASEALAGLGRRGFVSGGGDMSPPTGPVAIESPYGDDTPLKILDTDWFVATSGGYRRSRNDTDHIYDATTESLGSRHESVTVLARRDCMEADALATTLAALSLDEARELAAEWDGLEALIIHGGVFHTTGGFDSHVMDT
ncbi:flavin transferase ApbE [Natronomonas moolapensis 8.8.11]|uniref:FAD:protein FMN transferase n=1 Tax=Natronomonas moolapensis (strain DSM 18674 / CECT 7526 / JCM 14361 / 8.8.11) TaxID=268739 RepID=M1XPX3_NATM8|nr:FAD:protein FMN transferase [Natronomonas moolapensis]CCQ36128.1 flavin transferase ApbE [Natronomonas moolapensis 8.8.11]